LTNQWLIGIFVLLVHDYSDFGLTIGRGYNVLMFLVRNTSIQTRSFWTFSTCMGSSLGSDAVYFCSWRYALFLQCIHCFISLKSLPNSRWTCFSCLTRLCASWWWGWRLCISTGPTTSSSPSWQSRFQPNWPDIHMIDLYCISQPSSLLLLSSVPPNDRH